jgi:hypothetical protein
MPEQSARVSPSGLELFLRRGDDIGDRIYRYTRPSTNAPWALDGVQETLSVAANTPNATFDTSGVTLTADGLTAYMSIERSSFHRIYSSQRNAIGQPWSVPVQVQNISSGLWGQDYEPWINATGDRLYFMRLQAGAYRLLVATKTGNAFQTPTVLETLGDVRFPVLTADELTIYFASHGAPSGTLDVNIRKATRAKISDDFTQATEVPELNVPGHFSTPTWISPDGCETYLLSESKFDIFRATKPK